MCDQSLDAAFGVGVSANADGHFAPWSEARVFMLARVSALAALVLARPGQPRVVGWGTSGVTTVVTVSAEDPLEYESSAVPVVAANPQHRVQW